ncbi:hypothetical protein [Paenibacillus thalictri]|uniref:Uncharacterized protein n=1 Tax=Paenibacillus thalictri TaxID=2527873 RepID=A0A4Q9DRV9_9BACL|nr:hypothetical protein [Paenibacillus thalictri]TBL79529.1 hypothetical protein EYB31_11520 [Paenibacillus thalictri]
MKTVSLLAKVALSRYEPYMPGMPRSNYKAITLILLALFTVSLLFMRGYTSLNGILTAGVLLTANMLHILMLAEAPHLRGLGQDKHWWLLLPYPRPALLLGKLLAYVRAGMILFGYTLAMLIVLYEIKAMTGLARQADAIAMLQAVGANLLLALAVLPILAALGLLLAVFEVWWTRIVAFLGFMYLMTPLLIFSFTAGDFTWENGQLAPSRIVYYALLILAFGWPLACGFLWLTAAVGMKRLGRIRFHGGSVTADDTDHRRYATRTHRLAAVDPAKKPSPFWALVAMERRRFQTFHAHAPKKAKLIACLIMVILAAAGYMKGGDFLDLISLLTLMATSGYMGIVIYWLNKQADYQKGFVSWWLAIPVSRVVLVGSRVFAYATSMLVYFIVLVLCVGAGIALRQWANPLPGEQLLVALHYFSHYVVLMIPLAILYVISAQVIPAASKHPLLYLLVAPVYAGFIFGIQLGNRLIMPGQMAGRKMLDGPAPDFGVHLLQVYGIALPFAFVCFWLGAKYVNHYLFMKNSPLTGGNKQK